MTPVSWIALWLTAGCFGALLDVLVTDHKGRTEIAEMPTTQLLLILCLCVLLGPILIVTSALRWRNT